MKDQKLICIDLCLNNRMHKNSKNIWWKKTRQCKYFELKKLWIKFENEYVEKNERFLSYVWCSRGPNARRWSDLQEAKDWKKQHSSFHMNAREGHRVSHKKREAIIIMRKYGVIALTKEGGPIKDKRDTKNM